MKIAVNTKYVDKTIIIGKDRTIMMTPPIDEDYWYFKVNLFKEQSIVAFPKFGTMGVGFQHEEDWNTNLPFTCDAKEICNHIWHNRKYEEITKDQVIKAINLIQTACKSLKKGGNQK